MSGRVLKILFKIYNQIVKAHLSSVAKRYLHWATQLLPGESNSGITRMPLILQYSMMSLTSCWV